MIAIHGPNVEEDINIPKITNPENPAATPPEEVKRFQFSEETIRKAFIRKVYSILTLQLVISFSLIAIFTFNENAKQFALTYWELAKVYLIVRIAMIIAIKGYSERIRRTAPVNFIFLFIFTIAEGFLLGFISSVIDEKYVIFTSAITLILCLSLTTYAFFSKTDFTALRPHLSVILFCLVFFGFILIFYPSKFTMKVCSSLGTILFSCYLVYDTQLMVGGNHKFSLSPEEYIFAALNIFLDIIPLFFFPMCFFYIFEIIKT